jgi:hypothetical protein
LTFNHCKFTISNELREGLKVKTQEEIEARLRALEKQYAQFLALYEVEELTELPHDEYDSWKFTQARFRAQIDELRRVLNHNK